MIAATEIDWPATINAVTGLVGAVFAGIAAVYAIWAKVQSDRNATALAKQQVQADATTKAVNQGNVQNTEIKASLEEVKQQTNGLTDHLVKVTSDAAFIVGAKSETDKGKTPLDPR